MSIKIDNAVCDGYRTASTEMKPVYTQLVTTFPMYTDTVFVRSYGCNVEHYLARRLRADR